MEITMQKVIRIILVMIIIFTLVSCIAVGSGGKKIEQHPTLGQELLDLKKARDEGRPVIIDFKADWCLACKELEIYTFSDEKVMELYEKRTKLTQDDIEYADYVWQLYCSDNPMRLENLMDYDNFQFDYLSDAIKSHLQRFPSIRNGLNAVENTVLQIAAEQKPKSKKDFLGKILRNQGNYGFGDSQYDRLITNLKPLFSSMSPVRLSPKGKAVLNFKENCYSDLRNDDYYLGGALKYGFLYNTDNHRILKL